MMRITGNVGNVTGVYTNDKRISHVENTNKISPAKDDVKISNVGKDFTIAMNALKDVPDIRMDRVNELSAKIERGEYNVSGEDIASKILDIELFTEDNQSIGIVGAILPDVPASGSATMEVPIALGVLNTNSIKIRYSGN